MDNYIEYMDIQAVKDNLNTQRGYEDESYHPDDVEDFSDEIDRWKGDYV